MRDGELIANFAMARAFRVLAVVAVSLASFAHQAATQELVHRIGMIHPIQFPGAEQGFRKLLHARGYDEGRNLQIEFRYAQGQSDRIPALVAELAALHPELIGVSSPEIAVAVHAAAPRNRLRDANAS